MVQFSSLSGRLRGYESRLHEAAGRIGSEDDRIANSRSTKTGSGLARDKIAFELAISTDHRRQMLPRIPIVLHPDIGLNARCEPHERD